MKRPVHTYSIVARDARTGRLGVAVQSHWFNVGSLVPWAKAGAGAVATQALVDPGYGPRGLELMAGGSGAAEALRTLVDADREREVRQVALVDRRGEVAAHTGERCIEAAGHRIGDGYAVQANMMLTDEVVPAMARAYEDASGDLALRLVEALAAAQRAGGDVRGQQSAALLVVEPEASGRPWADRALDLRVEDHPEPVTELGRLLVIQRAYVQMARGEQMLAQGEVEEALAAYRRAVELAPDVIEVLFWYGLALATNGRVEESLPLFRRAFADESGWAELLRRLRRPGIIPDTAEGRALVDRILGELS